jgi:sterol desaturase/sphingolipid hydroxylase (fatty acid hydroxylase superfamily)
MPTPLEILLDPISLSIIAMYALLMIYEALFPAKQLPKVKFWVLRGIIFFFVYFYLSSYLPLLWAEFLPQAQLLDLSGIGVAGGAIAGVLLYEFGMYVWHRSMHSNNVLWRIFHQMHHSAERLDTYGAFYFSPFDMAGWTALGTLCFSVIMGLDPQATTIILLVTNFFSIFQHANINTPQWLGYIIQRPESHAYHHAQGIHRHNYSDLPIFDLLFGTFHNPKKHEYETGFYQGASSRVVDMLLFKDVSKES